MIKQIIFDLDGTLADTAKATIAAIAEAAPKFGLPLPGPDAVRDAIGIANPMFYYHLYPSGNSRKVLACGKEIERIEEGYIRAIGEDILFGGVVEMLNILCAMGKTLHLASTGHPSHVGAVLQSGRIAHHFHSIHCGKADKEDMVRDIVGGTPTREWILVGDHQKDIAAARANNIFLAGFGMSYIRPGNRALFDLIVPSPQAFSDWVRAQE